MSKVLDAPAAPSPAADPAATETFRPMQERVDALSGKAWDHYNATGDIDGAESLLAPVTEKPSSDVTPAPSPGDEPDAVPDEGGNEPDSAPGEPKGQNEAERSRLRREKNSQRWETLLEERGALRRENELLRQQLAGRTAEQPETEEAATEGTKRPEFPDIEAYPDTREGMQAWKADLRKYESALDAYFDAKLDQRLQRVETSRQQETVHQSWNQQRDAMRKEAKDFDASVDALEISLPAGKLIFSHPQGAKIAYHLSKHPEVAKSLLSLTDIPGNYKSIGELEAAAAKDPKLALKVGEALGIARVEFDRIAKELTSEKAGTVPPSKTLALKPKPTAEVSIEPRGSVIEDELADAIKRGDQDAYNRILDKRERERGVGAGY